MGLADELEKLAQLRSKGALSQDEFERAKARLLAGPTMFTGIRRQATTTFMGLPLWSIATGPDPAKGEARGHAKGIIALGDVATGVLAVGGFARGVFAIGGLALGFFSLGGLAVGLLLALGGGAVGGVAVGGGAAGGVAVGGAALGHYAVGGGVAGNHMISPEHCDPEAARLFRTRFAWLPQREIILQRCAFQ